MNLLYLQNLRSVKHLVTLTLEMAMHNVFCCGSESGMTSPAGMTISAYRRLRLTGVDWRRIGGILVGPLVRRHRLRAGSVRLWLDAVCRLDCGDGTDRRRES